MTEAVKLSQNVTFFACQDIAVLHNIQYMRIRTKYNERCQNGHKSRTR